jgi:hypothetical protein
MPPVNVYLMKIQKMCKQQRVRTSGGFYIAPIQRNMVQLMVLVHMIGERRIFEAARSSLHPNNPMCLFYSTRTEEVCVKKKNNLQVFYISLLSHQAWYPFLLGLVPKSSSHGRYLIYFRRRSAKCSCSSSGTLFVLKYKRVLCEK